MSHPNILTNSRQRGFTLVELAVVLVVIGLVLGGILMGNDLIRIANTQAMLKQLDQFNNAVNAFQNKYHCLPGDCYEAAEFGFDATSVGSGNGFIGQCSSTDTCNDPADAHEYVDFWYHLSAAGLIKYEYTSYADSGSSTPGVASPETTLKAVASNTPYGWSVAPDVAYVLIGPVGTSLRPHNFLVGTDAITNQTSMPGFLSADIYTFDQKIDDGLPQSGTVVTWSVTLAGGAPPNYMSFLVSAGPGGPNAAVCVRDDTTPAQYNVRYADDGLCSLIVKAAF